MVVSILELHARDKKWINLCKFDIRISKNKEVWTFNFGGYMPERESLTEN